MELLSEDDRNLRGMTRDQLDLAWDLWFDLAQTTNDSDPDYTHGVFVGVETRESDVKSLDARSTGDTERTPKSGS